jgi:hypothetical protein
MTLIPYSRSRKTPRVPQGVRVEGGRLAGLRRQIKQSCAFGLTAALAATAAPGAGTAQSPAHAADFEAIYGAYFLGLKVMQTELEARFRPDSYEVRSMYRTDGLISWIKQDEIVSMVNGRTDGERLSPAHFQHRDVLQRGRTVTMEFAPDDIEVTAEPPYSTFGEPPATQPHRRGALDLVSGIMQASMNIDDDPAYPCGRDIPIFNGKERYDLRMAYAGRVEAETDGYTGPAIACHVYYIPVAGFDPDDVPEEKYLNTPLTVWFTDTEEHEFHIPVRFSYPVGIGALVIEAKSLSLQSAAAH